MNDQKRFSDIIIVLCQTILQLIQDTEQSADVDIDIRGDFPLWMPAARDAADIFADATFDGLLRLHSLGRAPSPFPPQLPNIVSLLNRYVHSFSPAYILLTVSRTEMQKAFPKASDRAPQVDRILQHVERERYVH